ncbi:MAG TPA: penicillin-binding protein 2 [Syntrophobacteraceae bacterium]|jgi:penicillin-binding protein 2|nr:penicillin-binding protein 2 [Syntrophobacteraceae bacterium]
MQTQEASLRNRGGLGTEWLQLVHWEASESPAFQRPYRFALVLLIVVLLGYTFRLWYLQLLHGAQYRYYSENNRIRLEEIQAPRGVVFDRSGTVLVENRPAFHLMLIREEVSDIDETVESLAELCGVDTAPFYDILTANEGLPRFVPIRLAVDIDRDSLARIEAQLFRLPGVFVQVEPKREYRWNGVAAHLMGYMSEVSEAELKSESYRGYMRGEAVGKVGVEKAFEKVLHGKRGGRQLEVDAVGRRLRLLDEVSPVAGRNLWLTIDIELQKAAEACLKDRAGAIVALDPQNGAVLAMATNPSFDQERFVRGFTAQEWKAMTEDPGHPLLNRVFGAAYPPGSTYKPVLAVAALQEDIIKPNVKVSCPGYYNFAGRDYRCWRERGHGSVDLHQALVQSCDVYFYTVGMRLGVDRIAKYAKMLGLGAKTEIGLDREHPGLIPTSLWKKNATGVPWQKGETLSISIGQGFDLATPLQMAVAYAAIANGGKVWQPYVVGRIEGERPDEAKEVTGRLRWQASVSRSNLELVKAALMGVVEEGRGTAHGIMSKSIPIAGKTGTAQVVRLADGADRKRSAAAAKQKEKDHAWFVGYAPAQEPKIVVTALMEHGGHGASAAAPVVQQVILSYLDKDAGLGGDPKPRSPERKTRGSGRGQREPDASSQEPPGEDSVGGEPIE